MNTERIVILGGGLAGGTAAMALRENGFDGDVTIVGAESRPPYHRPPLSKGYLRGEEPFEDQLVKHVCRSSGTGCASILPSSETAWRNRALTAGGLESTFAATDAGIDNGNDYGTQRGSSGEAERHHW